ncbi:tyrosine-type recombinase/integrase [Aliarcobacter thereius]|uniref:Site-specific tyrosine recombinase XerC n=2 Tax=Aliarcobacter thereius TaxID=544718 RepID=A0A1C0B5N3_9BACT|nr:site-specific integrase [Aliarcobacter thereius]OCL90482.1 site-specific tyrosine recombinase XerC [Aliarcobacter thereius]OCL95723.1 site-specific tyrosine recombinase XerC [Aliarcobacter thereius LMG 24486]OCL98367.1 site-specific tyrosine recombinase XerC [Aliarcobacter thereius]QBF16294.1 site-specific recombinase, phage integrase family [Aliarcobacter thereius LMG 24486]TLS92083.1 site-specific integrase [Aliarcobacter thereius]
MAIPKTTKTIYPGIGYYQDNFKGKVFVATFTINSKKYRKIIGYENDQFKTNAKIAFLKKEELKSDIINNNYIKKDLTFKELFKIYIEHLENSRSVVSRTILAKKSNYNAHFKSIFDNLFINNIQSFQIQNLVNTLLKSKAPKTVDNLLADLSAIFKYAMKNKYITNNPVLLVDKPKYDNLRDYPLNIDESKRLFRAIIDFKEPLYKEIFTFLLHGRRKDEVLSLTWDMIDLEKRVYYIGFEINKAKKNMSYEITDELYEILANKEDKAGYVFKSLVTGDKVKNLRWAWKRILEAAEITKPIRIHDLRHLIGEISLNETDNSMEVVAAILGHSSTRPTRRYAKVQQKVAAQGLKKVFDTLK